MKLPLLTVESLYWVLKSLNKDEMCPNERAIQSRVKEAFGIKINGQMWEQLLDQVQKGMGQEKEKVMSQQIKMIQHIHDHLELKYAREINGKQV